MWYKECNECDFYYKDDEVEYCEVVLRDMPESNCIGKIKMVDSKLNKEEL